MKYNRNIGAKKYSSIEEIYDSVNNDPKRPGYQVVFLDSSGMLTSTGQAWYQHLIKNGYPYDSITEKYPKLDGKEYLALIIKATPEDALALKITF